MNNTSLPCIAATAGTRFGQDTQIENCQFSLFYLEFYKTQSKYIPPSCWFSRQAIDQYSSLLYYTYWGFFRPNVVDQPLSFDYEPKLGKRLPYLLLARDINEHLKANFFFFYLKIMRQIFLKKKILTRKTSLLNILYIFFVLYK